MRSTWNKVAALLLGLSLLGGGNIAAEAAMRLPTSVTVSRPAAQAPPDTTPADAQSCQDNQADDEAENDTGQDDQGEVGTGNQNEGTEAGQGEETDDEENGGETDDQENGAEESDAVESDDSQAAPGELSDGQDLLPQASITVDQAVAAAQDAATGDLGSIELEERNSTLVFEVTVGDQAVLVDAATGTVTGAEPAQNNQTECEDGGTAGAPQL